MTPSLRLILLTRQRESESLALFARMSATPDATRQATINTLIRTVKSAGVWAKLKALHVYAAHDSQAAALNWVSAAANATLVASPTFVADRWFYGNGSTSYINTGANPASLGIAQDSATWGFYCSSPQGSGTKSNGGWGAGFTHTWTIDPIVTASENPSYRLALNKSIGAYYQPSSQAPAHGLITCTRDSSTAERLHVRGVAGGASTVQSSTGVLNLVPFLGGMNNNGSLASANVLRHSAFVMADALTTAENLALSNALETYMVAVGNWAKPVVAWGDSQSIPSTWLAGMWKSAQDAGRVVRRATPKGVSAETSVQIRTRLVADASYAGQIEVIWSGRNDIGNAGQTINSATILSEVATMVATVQGRGSDYLVMPPCRANLAAGALFSNSEATGTTIGDGLDALKATLSSTYGNRYLDIEAKLIQWAGEATASTISGGVSPTADDIADAAAGITPRSLLADDIHKNATGNLVLGYYVEQHLAAQGM